MALNHHWQHGPTKQLTFPMIDSILAGQLRSIARPKDEWDYLRDVHKKLQSRRRRTLAYGKRLERART